MWLLFFWKKMIVNKGFQSNFEVSIKKEESEQFLGKINVVGLCLGPYYQIHKIIAIKGVVHKWGRGWIIDGGGIINCKIICGFCFFFFEQKITTKGSQSNFEVLIKKETTNNCFNNINYLSTCLSQCGAIVQHIPIVSYPKLKHEDMSNEHCLM